MTEKIDHLKAYRDKIAQQKLDGTYVAPVRRKQPSYKKAVAAKCRDCTYDELSGGSCPMQIACCIDSDCPLHAVRPVTVSKIPRRLLRLYNIQEEKLCDRTKPLVIDEEESNDDEQSEG